MSSLERLQHLIATEPRVVDAARSLPDEQKKLVNEIRNDVHNDKLTIQRLADRTGLSLNAVQISVDAACAYFESQASVFRIQRELVKAIVNVMHDRAISQQELGKMLNLSRAGISRLLHGRGQTHATLDRLFTVCHTLGLDASEILSRFGTGGKSSIDSSPSSDLFDNSDDTPIAGPLRFYIDSNAYSSDEKGELLSLISELFQLQTKDRLVIDNKGTAEPIPTLVGGPNGGAG